LSQTCRQISFGGGTHVVPLRPDMLDRGDAGALQTRCHRHELTALFTDNFGLFFVVVVAILGILFAVGAGWPTHRIRSALPGTNGRDHHLARTVKVARLTRLQYRPGKLPQIKMASCLHPLSRSRRNAVLGEAHQKAQVPNRATTDHAQLRSRRSKRNRRGSVNRRLRLHVLASAGSGDGGSVSEPPTCSCARHDRDRC